MARTVCPKCGHELEEVDGIKHCTFCGWADRKVIVTTSIEPPENAMLKRARPRRIYDGVKVKHGTDS